MNDLDNNPIQPYIVHLNFHLKLSSQWGTPPYELKKLLEHSLIETTMIYAHLEKRHLDDKMAKFAERMNDVG